MGVTLNLIVAVAGNDFQWGNKYYVIDRNIVGVFVYVKTCSDSNSAYCVSKQHGKFLRDFGQGSQTVCQSTVYDTSNVVKLVTFTAYLSTTDLTASISNYFLYLQQSFKIKAHMISA